MVDGYGSFVSINVFFIKQDTDSMSFIFTAGNYNTFTVVLVTSDKDSGQGSADTDSTLPPMNLQQPTLTDQDEPSITTSGD